MTGLVVSLVVSILSGFFLVWAFIPEREPSLRGTAFRASLGAGLGLAFSGGLAFLVTVTTGPYFGAMVAVEIVALLALATPFAVSLLRRKTPAEEAPGTRTARPAGRGRWLTRALAAGLVAAALMSGTRFVFMAISTPDGHSDAKSTWNLRAKQLVEYDEKDWRRAFVNWHETGLYWYLNYYPPLHSFESMRAWKWAGNETVLGPILTCAVFFAATAGLLVSTLFVAGRRQNAILIGIFFLGLSGICWRASSLYADVPVGFLFLAAVTLTALHERLGSGVGALALAGLATGMSLFTKQEGLLFTIVLSATVLWVCAFRGEEGMRRRRTLAFFAGLAPFAAMYVFFKVFIAQCSETSTPFAEILHRSWDLRYHAMVWKGFFDVLLDRTLWGVMPWVLPFYMLVAGPTSVEADRRAARRALMIMGAMVIGFYLYFVTAMFGLPGTIYSTFDRGMLQLWPAVLLGVFLWVRAPEEIPPVAPPVRA